MKILVKIIAWIIVALHFSKRWFWEFREKIKRNKIEEEIESILSEPEEIKKEEEKPVPSSSTYSMEIVKEGVEMARKGMSGSSFAAASLGAAAVGGLFAYHAQVRAMSQREIARRKQAQLQAYENEIHRQRIMSQYQQRPLTRNENLQMVGLFMATYRDNK
jgi:uncharacterized protein HemX